MKIKITVKTVDIHELSKHYNNVELSYIFFHCEISSNSYYATRKSTKNSLKKCRALTKPKKKKNGQKKKKLEISKELVFIKYLVLSEMWN